MEKHTIVELMSSTLTKIREMIDVDTVVGKAISTPDGTTIVPVSQVSFGFGAGGSDLPYGGKAAGDPAAFGGGSGAGVKIVPMSFLIVNGDEVRMIPVVPAGSSGATNVLESIPTVAEKVINIFKKKKKTVDDVEISESDILD